MPFITVDTAIEQIKNGKMIIVVDDDDRENEGDLVIPASFATAKEINFMAKYGRGLICLAMTKERIGQLGLPSMVQHNKSRHQTAFTVSIEAKEGVSTGISAFDRARTICVAINPQCGQNDLASPGHVFPLVAQDGGVLVRAGHTEAGVDLSRIAGLNPSAVICEIMNDDGTMARGDSLVSFAKKHDLSILTIADLIAWRRQRERLINKISTEMVENSIIGHAVLHMYENTLTKVKHLALSKGHIDSETIPLVRVQTINILRDVMGIDSTMPQIANALKNNEQSILIIMNSGDDIINPAHHNSILREYGIGAQILVDLGVKKMTLISGTTRTIVGLDGYGLDVVGFWEE